MKYLILFCLLPGILTTLQAQPVPPGRTTDWTNPGCRSYFVPARSVSLTAYGADSTGTLASDSAFAAALAALGGNGRIMIPRGTYLFNAAITLPDSVIIEGERDASGDSSLVWLRFFTGNNSSINITGSEANSGYTINYALPQGARAVYVSNPSLFSRGQYIRLYANDDAGLVNDSWARNKTGQILCILDIIGDSLVLDRPLRRSYSGTQPPYIFILSPRQQVHIRCVNLQRMDASTAQTSNIVFTDAVNCSVSGVESYLCNFAHISLSFSSDITIENNYLHHAYAYGGGGQGYGVNFMYTTGNCYVYQNNFNNLRHSMILQAGVNGNVCAYNYSVNPYWTGEFAPHDAAGDLVLHGNYPYMNLFEGNVLQNVVIDASHGINGPFNTYFRNRAALFGIVMSSGPATDSLNYIGNQVTDTTSFLRGKYIITGNGHYQYGNTVRGTITPAGTGEPSQNTLFHYNFGSFYQVNNLVPPITTMNWRSSAPLIEPEYRYTVSGQRSVCAPVVYKASATKKKCCLFRWLCR